MSSHVILTLSLKPVPILEINNNKTGGSGKLSDLPKYPLLVSYRCVTNYHKFSSLKQHKCIKSSVCASQVVHHKLSPGTSCLGSLLWNQGIGRGCNLTWGLGFLSKLMWLLEEFISLQF